MSRDFRRVVVVSVTAGLCYLIGSMERGPSTLSPDTGVHCFDNFNQPVPWQQVLTDDAWRWCGITPQRLMELKQTDWKAVATAKEREGFGVAAVIAGAAYLLLGVWLLRTAWDSSRFVRQMGRDASASALRFRLRRRKADRLWLLAWLAALPVLFVLPVAWRESMIFGAAVLAGLCVGCLPFYGLYRWLQGRKDEQEAKLARARRRDTRQHLATGRPVTSASEEERLGL